MYPRSAELYDAIYARKDYARDAARLHSLIRRHRQSEGIALLDVGCGTGKHLAFLRHYGYGVEGLDLDAAMLAVASTRYPDIPFHHADMRTFRLDRRFDAITCLFSAIAYLGTVPALREAIANLARHLRPGGVLIVEPWFTRESLDPDVFAPVLVQTPEFTVARLIEHRLEGNLSRLTFHYLVQRSAGVEHFTEEYDFALFSRTEFFDAFGAAGLSAEFDPAGLPEMGRGLYIARAHSIEAGATSP